MVFRQVARLAVPIAVGASALLATKALLSAASGTNTSMSLSEVMKRVGSDGSPPPSSAAAALRQCIPSVTNVTGERVPIAHVLPEGRVTVLHLLRRFK